MISTTLVVGASAADREQAIADMLAAETDPQSHRSAILLEGLANGKSTLEAGKQRIVERIAAGCLCCSNNMIMRVYLNRLIQQKPQRLFLCLSNHAHLKQITGFLGSPAYKNILELSRVLDLNQTDPRTIVSECRIGSTNL